MIRVLIVDDSAFMRSAIRKILTSDPEIEVVGTARDGVEAVERASELRPDVITMDVEMPRMDGIEALRRIMESAPAPVLMVSSLTRDGAWATLEALDLGAVDFVPKNPSNLSVDIVKIQELLVEKVRQVGRRAPAWRRRREIPVGGPAAPLPDFCPPARPFPRPLRRAYVVAIGTSTGGPKALQEIVPRLPGDFPVPVVVVQHMPPAFTGPFAQRLDQISTLTVKEAEEGEPLRPGVVLVAPGRGHMRIERPKISGPRIAIDEDRADLIYRPSVDVLMLSVAEHYPGRGLGVILTGMGDDGAKGMRAIKESGGRTIVQDDGTCVVYGMSRAVVEAGLADEILPLPDIAGRIRQAV